MRRASREAATDRLRQLPRGRLDVALVLEVGWDRPDRLDVALEVEPQSDERAADAEDRLDLRTMDPLWSNFIDSNGVAMKRKRGERKAHHEEGIRTASFRLRRSPDQVDGEDREKVPRDPTAECERERNDDFGVARLFPLRVELVHDDPLRNTMASGLRGPPFVEESLTWITRRTPQPARVATKIQK